MAFEWHTVYEHQRHPQYKGVVFCTGARTPFQFPHRIRETLPCIVRSVSPKSSARSYSTPPNSAPQTRTRVSGNCVPGMPLATNWHIAGRPARTTSRLGRVAPRQDTSSFVLSPSVAGPSPVSRLTSYGVFWTVPSLYGDSGNTISDRCEAWLRVGCFTQSGVTGRGARLVANMQAVSRIHKACTRHTLWYECE